VINSIINTLQAVVDYLCEKSAAGKEKDPMEIESVASDCIQLSNCTQTIIRIRLLDNYENLGLQFKDQLAKFLNSIFINLADSYPLIAIEFSRLIQLLSLNQN